MTHERRKHRQAQRRLKRDVMQNHMVLRGWVPVQLNTQWGILNLGENRLVLRKWEQPPQATKPTRTDPLGMRGRPLPPGQGTWSFRCIQLTAPFNGTEATWGAIQLRWVHALRAAAIQRGWL